MTDALQQPGLLSAFLYAIEQSGGSLQPGTYTAPTDILECESFNISDDPQIIEFSVMRGSRNTIQNTRAGIHKVQATATSPFYAVQGGALWRALLGLDVMSGATPVTITGGLSAATIVGATSVSVAAVPAPPTGISDWVGLFVDIESGANLDRVLVLAQTSTTLTVEPLTHAHASAAAASFPVQHCIQEYTALGFRHILATISSTFQFAEYFEWDVPFGFLMKGGIKGDSKTIKGDWSFCYSALPNDPGTLTTFTTSAAEENDSPFIMRDGGVITPWQSSDVSTVVGYMHNRLLSLDFEIDNGLETREYGGGVQLAEIYVPGERKLMVHWKEDAGQISVHPQIHTNFVKTQVSIPLFLRFLNPVTNFAWAAHCPNTKVTKYDPVTTMNEPIGFDAQAHPLQDPTRGYACRIALINGTTTAY